MSGLVLGFEDLVGQLLEADGVLAEKVVAEVEAIFIYELGGFADGFDGLFEPACI